MKTIFYNAAHSPEYQFISPLSVIAELKKFSLRKNEFEFLRLEKKDFYHDSDYFILACRNYYLSWLGDVIYAQANLTEEFDIHEYLDKYINHVIHFIKKEKIIEGNIRTQPSESLMREVEGLLNLKEKEAEEHRANILPSIAAFRIENPTKKMVYQEIFKDLYDKMKNHHREKNQVHITKLVETALAPQKTSDTINFRNRLCTTYGFNDENLDEALSLYLESTKTPQNLES